MASSIYNTSGIEPTAAPTTPAAPKTNMWESLGAAGWGALNSALFDIPEYLAKNVAPSKTYEALKALEERNKGAYTAGQIAGMFVPTGGLAAKGVSTGLKGAKAALGALKLGKAAAIAGKGAKALDTASDIIRGTKALSGVKGAAARGALSAAEQAVPRGLMAASEGEDLGTVGKETLGAAAMGGAIGAGTKLAGKALKALPEVLPETMKTISKWGKRTLLSNVNIDSRALRAQQMFIGETPEAAEALVKKAANKVAEKKLYFGPNLDKYRAGIADQWKTVGATFDDLGLKVADTAADIKADPRVANVLARMGKAGEETLDDIISKVDRTKGFVNKRAYLNGLVFNDKTDDEVRNLASVIKDTLEGAAEEASGLDMSKMKGEYGLKKLFEMADQRDKLSVKGAGLARGSDTAAKLALGGIGAVAGGGTGAVAEIVRDPSNPDAWSKLAAPLFTGVATGVLSNQVGLQLAKAAMKLDPDDVQELVAKVLSAKNASALQKVAESVGASIGKVTPALTEAAMKAPGILGVESTPESPAEAKVISKIEASEAQTSPEGAQKAQVQVSEKYAKKIASNLQTAWRTKYAAQGIGYEDFVRAVQARTDDFDPKKSAAILFPDKAERTKFLKDYDIALKLQGMDVESVYKERKATWLGQIFGGANAAESQFAYTNLIDTLASTLSKEGELPSAAEKAAIKEDLDRIMDLPASAGDKRQILLQKLSDTYGLSLTTLQDLGLA